MEIRHFEFKNPTFEKIRVSNLNQKFHVARLVPVYSYLCVDIGTNAVAVCVLYLRPNAVHMHVHYS